MTSVSPCNGYVVGSRAPRLPVLVCIPPIDCAIGGDRHWISSRGSLSRELPMLYFSYEESSLPKRDADEVEVVSLAVIAKCKLQPYPRNRDRVD